MNFVKSIKAVAAAAVAAAGLSAGNANAFFLYPFAILEDDDLEYFMDRDGNQKTSGSLAVGDRLRATIEIGKISDTFGVIPDQTLSTGGQPELTGISEIQIISIGPVAPDGTANIVFGPSAAFAVELAARTGLPLPEVAGGMVALWTDGTPDLNLADQVTSCPNIATCEANATNGNLWAVAGITGADPDARWFALNAQTNIGALAGTLPTTKVGTYNYALEVLVNQTGYRLDPVPMGTLCNPGFPCPGDSAAQVVGSGDVLGGFGLGNGYSGRSDFDFTVNAVPEPGSLALLAGAVLGAGFVSRRSKKA